MDYHQQSVFPGGNDVKVLAGNSGSNAPVKFDIGLPQSVSGEEPPAKKSRSSAMMEEAPAVSRSKVIAKMFYKTKLCSVFRAGPCVPDCRYAHGREELRQPPSNWKEIVAAQEDGLRKPPPIWREIVAAHEEGLRKPPSIWREIVAAREEDEAVSGEGFQIPEDSRRHAQHCKQFYTEEGCPFGDRCTFVHDEQAKARGSEAITIETMESAMPFTRKTGVCSKWEVMGFCPYENRCHYAHGFEDLRGYNVVHGESEFATTPTEAKQGVLPPRTPAEAVVGAAGALPVSEGEKRSRKEKIREIISILQSMIPGGEDKDVEAVIDEAIEYLKSLKVKAKDLGLDTH